MGFEDNRDRERNKQNIGGDIACTHGDKLSIALPTFRARVWNHLPVFVERLTLSESRDYHGDEGDDEKPPNELEAMFVGAIPDLTCETL